MLKKQKIGVVGMGVMGYNLMLNIERHGYSVSIFNRTEAKTKRIIVNNPEKKIVGFYSIEDFILSLQKPRLIFLMVQSGIIIDQLIDSFAPFLSREDILIDGGNSFYKDTIRRYHKLSSIGIKFIGLGISGGAKGALNGPSLMPGGDKDVYNKIEPLLKKISAVIEKESCVSYIGPHGSGHYVKMIHNGIEYGDMQLIAESYVLLKLILKLNNDQISKIFDEWNNGELDSYLIEITRDIVKRKTDDNYYLIDLILDEASHKGTGKWNSQSALDLGEPLTIITESVFFRYLSSFKCQRMIAAEILSGPISNNNSLSNYYSLDYFNNKNMFIEKIRQALYLSKIISYSQGFSQLHAISEKNHWFLDFSSIAKIWRGGCIIRSRLLQKIICAYVDKPLIKNLLLSSYFKQEINNYQQSLRDVVVVAVNCGISVPCFLSAISYYDGYRSSFLPANLIQAQRDYFGAHGYKRTDKDGIFHTDW